MIPDWANPYWLDGGGLTDVTGLLRPIVGLSIVAWTVFGIGRHKDAGQRFAIGLVGALWMMVGIVAVDLLPKLAVGAGWGSLNWWTYASGAPLLGATPVDLLIAWALAWGMLPLAMWSTPRPLPLIAAFGAIDLILMPRLDMVVELGPRWWVGELVLLGLVALPGLTLVNLMRSKRRLASRTLMLAGLFAMLFLGLVPLMAQDLSGVALYRPSWPWTSARSMALAQLMVVFGLPGLAAVRELYQRGRGTPYPWDPPVRVVSSGPYAYVRNPMQLSMTVLMGIMSVALLHWPLALAAATALTFSISVAEPHERSVLADRWGLQWDRYTATHRSWLPTWRPVMDDDWHAVVYIDGGCEVCKALGQWMAGQNPVALHIADARYAPGPVLDRITYRWIGPHGSVGDSPHSGSAFEVKGVRAFAAALEHINFGWAAAGWGLRLPVIGWWAQLIADAMIMAPHRAVPPVLPPLTLPPLQGRSPKTNGGPTPKRRTSYA